MTITTANTANPTGGADGPRLMLLDTASLYFRAYFGVPESVPRERSTSWMKEAT